MRRRDFLALVASALALRAGVAAQGQPENLRRLGYLGSGTAVSSLLDSLREGLRELGWVQGQNLVIDYRFRRGPG